jgi:hypothetical protein
VRALRREGGHGARRERESRSRTEVCSEALLPVDSDDKRGAEERRHPRTSSEQGRERHRAWRRPVGSEQREREAGEGEDGGWESRRPETPPETEKQQSPRNLREADEARDAGREGCSMSGDEQRRNDVDAHGHNEKAADERCG